MHTRETIQSPEFSDSEIGKLKEYFEINKKYHQLINEELTAVLKDDPFWGPLMRLSTPEQTRAQNERSLELQRAAIYEGKWNEYANDLIVQGRTYARMNVTYTDWYGIIRLYKDHLLKYVKKDFDDVGKAVSFIEGLTLLLDYAMYGIAEAYFQEKNSIIREKEGRFRAIFENSVDYIYLIDKDRNLQMTNRSVAGSENQQIIGKNFYEISKQEPKDIFRNAIESVFETKSPARFETEFRLDGTLIYLASSASPVLDEKGEVSAVVIISRDITDKKETENTIREINASLEMKVQQRTEDLKNINKELESFSYSVSHDLRGPLRAISGFTQILAEEIGENLSEGAKDAMEEIITNATKMGTLIDDLLEFSRLGKKQVAKVDIGMNELIKTAIDEVKKTNKKINFQVGELGHASGDYGMIRQVVINLLSNAVKYSGKNADPYIEIGSFKQNGNAGFYVKDNGVGFDMAYYDKLFGVFQRLHRADEFEGTGVGLAIVQRIITKHSGKVWAEAKVNEGATFYFSLPLN